MPSHPVQRNSSFNITMGSEDNNFLPWTVHTPMEICVGDLDRWRSLSLLTEPQKRKVWRHVSTANVDLAELLSSEEFRQLQQDFNAEIEIEISEFPDDL